MTPELKSPSVEMPYEGDYTQEEYAQQMIDEYKNAGVLPRKVFAQSFNLGDILYWIDREPTFGRQAVYLDDADTPADLPGLAELNSYADQGVNIVAPPMWALLALDGNNRIIPSEYALNARMAGLNIITWSLERSGPLLSGGGWYHQTITHRRSTTMGIPTKCWMCWPRGLASWASSLTGRPLLPFTQIVPE
jgi:glycerophosphoryl diester phosphodiesterase